MSSTNPIDDEEGILADQKRFLDSKELPSAKLVTSRKIGVQNSSSQVPRPSAIPEFVPQAIKPNYSDSTDDKDIIDILGPIQSQNLPGVDMRYAKAAQQNTPNTQKKSLFAQKREQYKSSLPILPSLRDFKSSFEHRVPLQASEEPSLISDLVERDVIQLDINSTSSSKFNSNPTGFPTIERMSELKIESKSKSNLYLQTNQQNPISPSLSDPSYRPFYSSSRGMLEETKSLNTERLAENSEDEDDSKYSPHQLGEPNVSMNSLLKEISDNNVQKLSRMSQVEIEKLQLELSAHLNPKFVQMLKERGKRKPNQVSSSPSSNETSSLIQSNTVAEEPPLKEDVEVVTSTGTYSLANSAQSRISTVKLNKQTFMTEIESKKRQWMLPMTNEGNGNRAILAESSQPVHMTAELYRFDFEGRLLYYPSKSGLAPLESIGPSQDLNMLLHHGEEAQTPGYTLDEIFHLLGSKLPSQKIYSLVALSNIIYKAKRGYYSIPNLGLPNTGQYQSFPSSLFLTHLIQSLHLPISLRICLDESNNTAILHSLMALHSLLVNPPDEITFLASQLAPSTSHQSYTTQPCDQFNIPLSHHSDWDDKSDSERCEVDMIMALLQTGILSRFRYLMKTKASENPNMMTLILELMISFARHSSEASYYFRSCPGLFQGLRENLLLEPFISNSNPVYQQPTIEQSSSLGQSPLSPNKKAVPAPQDHPTSSTDEQFNVILVIKLLNILCESEKLTASEIIYHDLVTSCFKFIALSNSNSSEDKVSEWGQIAARETFNLMATCLKYGMIIQETVNMLPVLIELVRKFGPLLQSKALSSPSNPKHPRAFQVQSYLWNLFASLIPLARDIPEGEEVPSFAILWSVISPIFNWAITLLSAYLQSTTAVEDQKSSSASHTAGSSATTTWTNYNDCHLSSVLYFVSTYFDHMKQHPPRSYEDEDKAKIRNIAATLIGPLVVSSQMIRNTIFQLCSINAWKFSNTTSGYFDLAPRIAQVLDMKSLTSFSIHSQPLIRSLNEMGNQHDKSSDLLPSNLEMFGTVDNSHPKTVAEFMSTRNFQDTLSLPVSHQSTLLHHSALLLSLLQVVQSIHHHDPWLSGYLTASEISKPLVSILERYSQFFMSNWSSSKASSLYTRVIHHLAFQTIKLLYRGSTAAQEAALVCIGFLLPGDEKKALYLLQRVIFHYSQDTPTDVLDDIAEGKQNESTAMYEQSQLSKLLDISPSLLHFFSLTIMEGHQNNIDRKEESSQISALVASARSKLNWNLEYPSPDVLTLFMPVEGSALPLGKSWTMEPVSNYSEHIKLETEARINYRKKARNQIIQKALQKHQVSGKTSVYDIEVNEAEAKYLMEEEEEEWLEDLQTPNTEKSQQLKAGIQFIGDCLKLVCNLESTNTIYTSNIKRSTKLYTIMQSLCLGRLFFTDPVISACINDLLRRFVGISQSQWDPYTLNMTINTSMVDRLVEVWDNESFGNELVGQVLSLWFLCGAGLNNKQLIQSGQIAELKAVDSNLWLSFAQTWYLLPVPVFEPLQSLFFTNRIIWRNPQLISDSLISALTSPHTPVRRQDGSFWYKFIRFQLSNFLLGPQPEYFEAHTISSLPPSTSTLDNNISKAYGAQFQAVGEWQRKVTFESFLSDISNAHTEMDTQLQIICDLLIIPYDQYELEPKQWKLEELEQFKPSGVLQTQLISIARSHFGL